MKDGYLIVRCFSCGSVSRLAIDSIRSRVSKCPVCCDGDIECKAIQCVIMNYKQNSETTEKLYPYLLNLTKFSVN